MAQEAPSTEETPVVEQKDLEQKEEPQQKQKKKKKKKNKGETIELSYECMASAEMMVKIFKMEEDRFLKAVFYGQVKQADDVWIIGDGQSFTFKIIESKVTEDEEHILNVEWH